MVCKMSDSLIGKTIGGYEILEQIGEGGMATVYLARQQSMNRQVALKVLPRQFLKDDTYIQRFHQEVEIVSQLEHRNIVPVYDYGEYDGQPYIVMRYMPAGSVDDILKIGAVDADTMLSIITQVSPALDYAHNKGILHRDLKPSNILMDDRWRRVYHRFWDCAHFGRNQPSGDYHTGRSSAHRVICRQSKHRDTPLMDGVMSIRSA